MKKSKPDISRLIRDAKRFWKKKGVVPIQHDFIRRNPITKKLECCVLSAAYLAHRARVNLATKPETINKFAMNEYGLTDGNISKVIRYFDFPQDITPNSSELCVSIANLANEVIQ